MKFNDYKSIWDYVKRFRKNARTPIPKGHMLLEEDPTTFYFRAWEDAHTEGSNDYATAVACVAEAEWIKNKRPYYNVWPKLVSCLMSLDLEKVPISQVKFPDEPILFRFPEGNEPIKASTGHPVMSVLIAPTKFGVSSGEKGMLKFPEKLMDEVPEDKIQTSVPTCEYYTEDLMALIFFNESLDEMPIISYTRLSKRNIKHSAFSSIDMNEITTKTCIDLDPVNSKQGDGIPIDEQIRENLWKVVVSCLLLSYDMYEPDVLSRDAGKPITDAVIDRAHRRGKRGYHLGRELDCNPHWRKPHPAVVWTGKGRKIPKIVIRKGSIVKRQIASKIPTGRLDQDGRTSNNPGDQG